MKEETKLYNQTEIAVKLGISEATVSRLIKKSSFRPIVKNNQKLFSEKVMKELRKQRKTSNSNGSSHFSTIELLQEEITQLKSENSLLRKQLEIKDRQIENAIKLADQAQKLNLADKPRLTGAETSNQRSSSVGESDNQPDKNAEKPRSNWFQRHFGGK